jgi:hypothetical protein
MLSYDLWETVVIWFILNHFSCHCSFWFVRNRYNINNWYTTQISFLHFHFPDSYATVFLEFFSVLVFLSVVIMVVNRCVTFGNCSYFSFAFKLKFTSPIKIVLNYLTYYMKDFSWLFALFNSSYHLNFSIFCKHLTIKRLIYSGYHKIW